MAKRRSTQLPLAKPLPANATRLLAVSDYDRIEPTLQVIALTLKDVMHKPGDPVRHGYFPGGGFFSVLTVLEDGAMVEVATIGREGMVGASAVLEDDPRDPSADSPGRISRR